MIMQQPNPQKWEYLLAGYVLGDLTSGELTDVQVILATHPELFVEIDSLQEALALLPLGLDESMPSSNLRDRIAAAVEEPSPSITKPIFSPQIVRSPKIKSPKIKVLLKQAQMGLGTVAAIALIFLSIDNYRVRQKLAMNQAELQEYRQMTALLQNPHNRMLSLKGMGTIPTASGSLMIAPMGNMAVIGIQNLSPLPEGNIYRLWAIVDGKKVDFAQFRPDSQGRVFAQVPLGNALAQSTTVVITIEPNKNMPEPTGEMVMKGEISL